MIHPFTETPLPTLEQVGGKGLSLMRLTDADLPVPPGFVCSVEFFRPWLISIQSTAEWAGVQTAIQNEDSLALCTEAIKNVCSGLQLTRDQEQQLGLALQSFPEDGLFAVRSSSPEEDLAGASFAGGYTTTLGVTRDTMLDALRDSFASAFDERVFVYKEQHGFAVENPRIAVVVQQQVAADCAGVGFSLNPLNNDYDEAVIDANWGLGESVVSGIVSPDQFVVDKVSKTILAKNLGGKEKTVFLSEEGGIEESYDSRSNEFCLAETQVLAITEMLVQIEHLYEAPIDIEWAFAGGVLYLLQARPITAYVPLPPEMMTEPGERRTLYFDFGLVDVMTINQPMSPLTLDWMFGSLGMWSSPFIGPVEWKADGEPAESFLFGAGGRTYMNFSQLLAIINISRYSGGASQMDALTSQLMANIDTKRYKAKKKIPGLRWLSILRYIPRVLGSMLRFMGRMLFAIRRPEQFYRHYEQVIEKTVRKLKDSNYDALTLREMIVKLNDELTPIIGKVSAPPMMAYMHYMMKYMGRVDKLISDGSKEDKQLAEALSMGFAGNEAVNMGIQLYRMARMLSPDDLTDLDKLAQRVKQRELSNEFLEAWDAFVDEFGLRGPCELELSNARYGDDPRLALEQMSYMVSGNSDPEEMLRKHMAARQQAYEQLLEKLSGRQRRRLERVYKILELYGPARDTPKYLWVLNNGAVRHRALQEGHMFVEAGRLDAPEDIFWLTLDEIDTANADPSYDLRQARDSKKPYYRKLDKVVAFPHMIDSRGRIGQVEIPKGDPNLLMGQGISRGKAIGRVKVLDKPREKPIEKGDVLVTYTTDPGWTPLFVNAEAIILEIGGMLQHGGVVAREYGKPCVVGIQGITTTLQDGQLVEVDGTAGVIRLLDA